MHSLSFQRCCQLELSFVLGAITVAVCDTEMWFDVLNALKT